MCYLYVFVGNTLDTYDLVCLQVRDQTSLKSGEIQEHVKREDNKVAEKITMKMTFDSSDVSKPWMETFSSSLMFVMIVKKFAPVTSLT